MQIDIENFVFSYTWKLTSSIENVWTSPWLRTLPHTHFRPKTLFDLIMNSLDTQKNAEYIKRWCRWDKTKNRFTLWASAFCLVLWHIQFRITIFVYIILHYCPCWPPWKKTFNSFTGIYSDVWKHEGHTLYHKDKWMSWQFWRVHKTVQLMTCMAIMLHDSIKVLNWTVL